MIVSFRVDAGAGIGNGHLMRCLTLADALSERGATSSFIVEEGVKVELDRAGAKGHTVLEIPARGRVGGQWSESGDASQTFKSLSDAGISPDWLVVDHYRIGREWEGQVRLAARRLLVIDDLANRPHNCDLLVDPTFAQTEARYRDLLPEGCRRLCGSEYALLRPQFRRMRQDLGRSLPAAQEMCVHVFFGSSDTENHTLRYSRLLLRQFKSLRLRAAVGHGYPHRALLQKLSAEAGGRFSWAAGISDMAAHMAGCDVAIGAPGGTTWERACVGLPAAYLAVSANQSAILEQLQIAGLCAYFGMASELGDEEFLASIERFLADVPRLREMRVVGMNAIDGIGAERVARALEQML